MTRDSSRIAGWYDDQADAALLRYWDGAKWSPHTAPKPADAPRPARIEPIDDTIDDATTVRHGVPEEHTARLRPPEEHTTVPLPGTVADGASAPHFSSEPYRSTGRTFVATWLFALLLGSWGADRFYLGKMGTAVLKLVTIGGLGVWVLVDLLLVLSGAQRDGDGRPLEGYDEHRRVAWIVTGSLITIGLLTIAVSSIVAIAVR